MLNTTETEWRAFFVTSQHLAKVEPLFERIDQINIEKELERLNSKII